LQRLDADWRAKRITRDEAIAARLEIEVRLAALRRGDAA
jgi:hypothetical protein